jgi:hypothetical protein
MLAQKYTMLAVNIVEQQKDQNVKVKMAVHCVHCECAHRREIRLQFQMLLSIKRGLCGRCFICPWSVYFFSQLRGES